MFGEFGVGVGVFWFLESALFIERKSEDFSRKNFHPGITKCAVIHLEFHSFKTTRGFRGQRSENVLTRVMRTQILKDASRWCAFIAAMSHVGLRCYDRSSRRMMMMMTRMVTMTTMTLMIMMRMMVVAAVRMPVGLCGGDRRKETLM